MNCADCGHSQLQHDPKPNGLCAECDRLLIEREGNTATRYHDKPDTRCKGFSEGSAA